MMLTPGDLFRTVSHAYMWLDMGCSLDANVMHVRFEVVSVRSELPLLFLGYEHDDVPGIRKFYFLAYSGGRMMLRTDATYFWELMVRVAEVADAQG